MRRDEHNHLPLVLDENSRICLNCNRVIMNDIALVEADPACLRLHVITQTASCSCIICYNQYDIQRLSLECRVQVFVKRNIYILDNVRSCEHHLDNNGCFFNMFLLSLQFINRPYVIRGQQLQVFLPEMRNVALSRGKSIDYDNLSDEEFECLSPINKQQFEDLLTYCDPTLQNEKLSHVSRLDLLIFLCNMRQEISDDFLKVIFDQSSRQNVSFIIDYVKSSLLQRFVPDNIGPQSITRQQFIEQHVTEFANELYNPQPEERRVIAVIDRMNIE